MNKQTGMENQNFMESKYKSLWAYMFFLTCSDLQLQNFKETNPKDCFEEFNWAYNFLCVTFGVDK